MKHFDPKKFALTGVVIAGFVSMNPALAQNYPEVVAPEQRYEDVSSEFSEFLGDDSDAILNSLRNGEAVSFERDGETVTVESSTEAASPGEVSLALGLAQEELGNDATTGDIAEFLHGNDGVMQMRAEGRGWGEIYQDYGLTVGEVMSRVRANETARSARAEDARDGNAQARAERPGNARPDVEPGERPDRPERPARPEQANIPPNDVRPDIANRPERPQRPGRPERPQR